MYKKIKQKKMTRRDFFKKLVFPTGVVLLVPIVRILFPHIRPYEWEKGKNVSKKEAMYYSKLKGKII